MAPAAVHEEGCWFQYDDRNVGKNPQSLVPCLGPHGMTKIGFLWTSFDTLCVGSLFFLCMERTVVEISSGNLVH